MELWMADIGADPPPAAAWATALGHLSATRQDRVRRVRDPMNARQLLAAEVLLRWALAARLGRAALHAAIRTDPQGKPHLADGSDVHFNLSHSGSAVCLAVDDMPVGVDVETMRLVDPAAFDPWLAPSEQVWTAAGGDHAGRLERLMTVWTRKESVTKAMGVGHALPFATFSVVSPPPGELFAVVSGWRVASRPLPSGHMVAVARLSDGRWPPLRLVGGRALLESFNGFADGTTAAAGALQGESAVPFAASFPG